MTALQIMLSCLLFFVVYTTDGQQTVVRAGTRGKPPDSLSKATNILKATLREAESSLLLQDGSPQAADVLQSFLTSNPLLPLQFGSLKNLLQEPTEFDRFLLNVNEQGSVAVILFSSGDIVRNFLSLYSEFWVPCPLLLLNLSPEEDARDILQEVNHIPRSSLLQLSRQGTRFCLFVYDPFLASENFILQECGSRIVFSQAKLFPERFLNFLGHRLQVASWVDDFPYLFFDNDKKAAGSSKNMMDEIGRRLNYTYDLQDIPPDGGWGELVNGTWRGMAGQLVSEEKDLIINGFNILLDRYHVLDFSVPYVSDSFRATLKIPPPPPRWLSVVHPFNGLVWACAVATLIMLTCAFHVIIRKDHTSVYEHNSDLISTALWLSRTVLRQSVTSIPEVVGCRTVLLAWWLAALVLSTSYTGSLIAFITVPSEASRISTLKELAHAPNKLTLYDYGEFIVDFLQTSQHPVYHALGKKLVLNSNYDVSMEDMKKGLAFIEIGSYTDYLMIQYKMVDVYEVGEGIYPSYLAFAFQKHTPWKKHFDRYITMMLESGLVSHWFQTTIAKYRVSQGLPPQPIPPAKEPLRPLSLEDIQGPIITITIGLSVAIVAFGVEIFIGIMKWKGRM